MTRITNAVANTLSDLMDFGRVIVTGDFGVRPDERTHGVQYVKPEEIQYVDLDADGGAPDPIAPDGWEYLTGWTGQYGYSGPVMHSSEYIGGRLADHILSNPGYYVSVMIDALPLDDESESESIGWGVLHYIGSN